MSAAQEALEAIGVASRQAWRFIPESNGVGWRSETTATLRKRIKEMDAARVRYGFRRIHVLIRRAG